MRVLFFLFTAIFLCQSASGQNIDTSKYNTMLKGIEKAGTTLFVHCDKTVYANNETIWFTAYLTGPDEKQMANPDILSAFLLLEGSNKVVLSEQYFMASGMAFGSIELPDTIPPGNYKLVAYTNRIRADGLPSATFTQRLSIKTTAEQKFSAELQVLPLARGGSSVEVQIKIKGLPVQNNGKFPSASIEYYLKDKAQSAESNADGMLLISLPIKDIDPLRNKFYAQVKFYDEIKHLSATLPVGAGGQVDLKFYPEGGELTDQLRSVIGIEALGDGGQPLVFKGVVYEGTKPIDTIETNANGFAQIALVPKQGADYYVRSFLEREDAKAKRFNFPEVKKGYPVLTVQKALVSDSLSFVLNSKDLSDYNVVVHQGREVYLDFIISANIKGRPVKIPLTDIPRGIAAITVLDKHGKPLAERLFFAHYPRRNTLSIGTEKEEFGKRQKVNLKLKMDHLIGMEQNAVVSVACVQTSRLEYSKFQDIKQYSFFTSKLMEGDFLPQSQVFLGPEYLENVLLIKGWRKFKDVNAQSSLNLNTLGFTGTILKNGKKVVEPVSFTVLRDSAFSLLSTDSTGHFKLATQDMLHGYGRKMMFSINKPNRELYTVHLADPFKRMDSIQARVYGANEFAGTKNSQTSEGVVFDSKTLKLKEVVISGKRGNQDFGKSAKNECGDFVCPSGILNCTLPGDDKAMGAHPPVLGQRYKVAVRSLTGIRSMESRLYKGCASASKVAGAFQGVLYAREFYMNDYANKNVQPLADQSTMYWSHSIELNSKNTEVSFYTGDLGGNYRIVIQGLSSSGPVFATKDIKVN